jgi:hypothetical protein
MNKEQIERLIKCLEHNTRTIQLLADNNSVNQELANLQIANNNQHIVELQMMLQLEK